MKKVLAIFLALVMLLGVSACGDAGNVSGGGNEIDMSAYPADLNEWSSQNFLDYFAEVGVFENEDWRYIQDHATYYAGTPINECAGYMDDEAIIMIGIFTIDSDSADAEELLSYIKEHKATTDELGAFPIDHMVGNVLFWYSETLDEDVYNAMDEAYNGLVSAMGLTPEF